MLDANGNTVDAVYDDLDRPTTVIDGENASTVFDYLDGVLRQISLPDSSGSSGAHTGRLALMEYDSAGRPLAVKREDSSNSAQLRVGYGYDGFSQLRSLVRLKNGLEKSHTSTYDRQGRTVSSTDFNGKTSTAAYEPFCGGFATTSARGVRRRASFDTLCRLTQVEVGTPDSDPLEVAAPSESREFEYDDLGRLIKTVQSTSAPSTYGVAFFGVGTYGSGASQSEERSYEYDSLDRLTKITFEDGKTMEYEYDEEGNVTKITENASSSTPKVTEFSYYGDNRLHQITYVRSGGNQVFTYAYDDGGRPLTLTYPTSTGIVAHFDGPLGEDGWDGNGQLLHLRYVKGGTTVIRRFEYQYDDFGNRISQLDVTPTKATKWEYGYDWLDRLESVKKAEGSTAETLDPLQLISIYTYDSADNRIEFQVPNLNPALTETFTYSYKDGDEIQSISKAVGSGSPVVIETFTSDDDGNLLTRTDTATSVVTSYTWDDFNRLTAVSATDASKNQTHTFGVNGFRRKKKDKNDVETTEYAAGLETAVAKNSTETITYLTGGGGIMGFERTSDGAMFYFITDALTTVRDVVDNSGTVVAGYEFSEYGQKLSPANTNGIESQKTFVGGMSVQDEVADTGLMLMGHRFYDPGLLGRFLNRDPIGYAGGMNLYSYSSASPVLLVDPDGFLPISSSGIDEYGLYTADDGLRSRDYGSFWVESTNGMIHGPESYGYAIDKPGLITEAPLFGALFQGIGHLIQIAKFKYFGYTLQEVKVIKETKKILKSPQMRSLRTAAECGESLVVNVGKRIIQFEPDLPGSGMTMFGENGFLLGKQAFTSVEELTKTVLHELFRLSTSKSASGVSSGLVKTETGAAFDFAEVAYKGFFK